MPNVTKLNLRLPAAVREEAAVMAEAQGLSLNAYLLRAVMNANAYWGPKLVKQQRQRQQTAAALRSLPPGRPADSEPEGDSGEPPQPARRTVPKVGGNQPCPCGSGQKYKRCHGRPAAA